MNRTFVDSSDLVSVGYNDGLLEIEFQNNSVYQYNNVPYNVYKNLMSADSHGKYFQAYIKGDYSYIKIS